MTDQQINIAIAEACGWTDVRDEEWESVDIESRSIAYGIALQGTINGERGFVPNYIKDLNAMHEAEKTLLKMDECQAHWETYSNILAAKLGCEDIFHATARQRCEAFIKTLNLELQ